VSAVAPSPLLTIRGLKKSYPIITGLLRRQTGVVQAVNDVDFKIYPGQVVGMVGESGSGKSTLARAAIRLIEPTAGQIIYEGQDVLAFNKKSLSAWRRQVQMVFQDPYASLNPRKTVGASIGEALLYHKMVSTVAECDAHIARVLWQVGLPASAAHRYPHAFSGGQQQRICIGRAIALHPRLLVCDEAVSALDVSVQAQVINLLRELKKELQLSYLFISHDLATVRNFCDYVIVLYLGQVMERGSVEQLFARPLHPYTQALLAAVPRSHPAEKKCRIRLSGEIPSAAHPPSGCPFRTRCPYAKAICQQEIPWQYGADGHAYRCVLPPDISASH
jgi:oligopeptide/dipeptide ABC transporter ATP-binding protein